MSGKSDEERQLKSFIDEFKPAHQTLIGRVRAELRRLLPTANELVYDNYNFFVIGFGPTERRSVDGLKRPEIKKLIEAAVGEAKTPLPARVRGKLIIRSVSANQRPRRRATVNKP